MKPTIPESDRSDRIWKGLLIMGFGMMILISVLATMGCWNSGQHPYDIGPQPQLDLKWSDKPPEVLWEYKPDSKTLDIKDRPEIRQICITKDNRGVCATPEFWLYIYSVGIDAHKPNHESPSINRGPIGPTDIFFPFGNGPTRSLERRSPHGAGDDTGHGATRPRERPPTRSSLVN